MGKRKSASFDKEGIGDLAQDKPVVYKLLNAEVRTSIRAQVRKAK